MTKLEHFQEIKVQARVHPWERVCYWCGVVFRYHARQRAMIHENIEHETKYFCSEKCKLEWIYTKQTFGVEEYSYER